MVSIPSLIKDDFERLSNPTEIDSPVNRVFTVVAQEVMELLKRSHSFQTANINHTETTIYARSETIMIQAIEPEYRQAIAIEPLTERELEVLQLIVEGHNNSTIAGKLYLATTTVKTHVRNILKKLYVRDRTQAAICALRSGLVH